MLFLVVLVPLGFLPAHGKPPAALESERVVFLAGDLAEEELIALSANLAASGHPGVLLLDTPRFSTYTRSFLTAFQPEHVVPVGSFSEDAEALDHRLGVKTTAAVKWKHNLPPELGKALFPRAERVVVSPAEPRRLLLHAAALAGALRAPLYVQHGRKGEDAELRRWVADWQTQEIYLAGTAHAHIPNLRLVRLADEEAVAASCLRHTLARGAVDTLIVANPADARKGMGCMSCLAPWLAAQRRAALLLTNDEGDNTPSLVTQALKSPRLRCIDNLLLLADLRAIPMEHRPNPIAGKDPVIEMEPLTPTGTEAFTFATGRLFHPEAGVVTLMLARQRLLAERPLRKALVVSNPGGSLQMLEVFSRNTARELRNCGFETTAIFGKDVDRDTVRRLLPEHDLFLWEGHQSTLIKEYEMPTWAEPLPASFVFLQSCLALEEPKAHPLLERGAFAVVGSSTRTYSGTGGAFSLAYFNALLYDGRSLGGSLRQAKNFLLAYTLLKEKRLGKDAKLNGANLRSAWAFSLWGDPALKLPIPAAEDGLASVGHEVHGHAITVKLPDTTYDRIVSGRFQADMRPNARLAGLLRAVGEDERQLVPFVFAEVHLPKVPAEQVPQLTSKLPGNHWVFCWDSRRRCGYLLVTPRPRDQRELRFHVSWENPKQSHDGTDRTTGTNE
jgi:hypothetical protein